MCDLHQHSSPMLSERPLQDHTWNDITIPTYWNQDLVSVSRSFLTHRRKKKNHFLYHQHVTQQVQEGKTFWQHFICAKESSSKQAGATVGSVRRTSRFTMEGERLMVLLMTILTPSEPPSSPKPRPFSTDHPGSCTGQLLRIRLAEKHSENTMLLKSYGLEYIWAQSAHQLWVLLTFLPRTYRTLIHHVISKPPL